MDHLVRARQELKGYLSHSVASKVSQGRVGAGGRTENRYITASEYHEMGYDLLTVGATMQTVLMKSLADASKLLLSSGGDARELDAGAMPFKEWIELVDFSYWNHINGN